MTAIGFLTGEKARPKISCQTAVKLAVFDLALAHEDPIFHEQLRDIFHRSNIAKPGHYVGRRMLELKSVQHTHEGHRSDTLNSPNIDASLRDDDGDNASPPPGPNRRF